MSNVQLELPPIAIIRGDMEKLIRLADAADGRFAQTGDFLSREIDRAQVLEKGRPDLVAMGSRVTFRDNTTDQTRTVTLVYPEDADVAQNRISVLTPIGAALIGLSTGQSIAWQTLEGQSRSLTVIAVEAGA
jgi:regulator of nucleoside diphosphate kinase